MAETPFAFRARPDEARPGEGGAEAGAWRWGGVGRRAWRGPSGWHDYQSRAGSRRLKGDPTSGMGEGGGGGGGGRGGEGARKGYGAGTVVPAPWVIGTRRLGTAGAGEGRLLGVEVESARRFELLEEGLRFVALQIEV